MLLYTYAKLPFLANEDKLKRKIVATRINYNLATPLTYTAL